MDDLITDQELVEELKVALRITWDEEDAQLASTVRSSRAYLQELCGKPLDFSIEGQPKFLLLERVRYVYNNAADEFEENFKHELSRLILNVALGKVGVSNETSVQGDV